MPGGVGEWVAVPTPGFLALQVAGLLLTSKAFLGKDVCVSHVVQIGTG
jgi:hypothetical protein